MIILYDYEEHTGEYNMKFDSFLLDEAIKSQTNDVYVRFYGWKPACVSIGRNQSFINTDTRFCKKNNIDIVKRITGGRGLLHDCEITYSFICNSKILNNPDSVIGSYKEISSAIIEGFKTIDIELEFGGKNKVHADKDYCMLISTGADLCYKGKKLIGSAQYRKQNYILQHGSVLINYNKNLVENIFKEKIDPSAITCISEINPKLTKTDILNALKKGFNRKFIYNYS